MVITPEAIYPNCNIVGYDYSREAGDGARMIKANIHLQEIREVEVQYTTTKTDTASPTKDAGSVSTTGASSSFDKTSILKKIKDKGLSGVLSEAKDEIVKVFQ